MEVDIAQLDDSNGSDDQLDGCDVEIRDAVADEDLPAATGGVAQS